VLELAGVRNVLAKSLGTTNPINMAKATVVALRELRRPEDVARIRGKTISEVLPLPASAIGQSPYVAPEKPVAVVVEEAPAVVEEVVVVEEAAPVAVEVDGSDPVEDQVAEVPVEPAAAAEDEKPKRRLRRKKDDA
jgi:hypothetical protein